MNLSTLDWLLVAATSLGNIALVSSPDFPAQMEGVPCLYRIYWL
jgi:hypothetical protein